MTSFPVQADRVLHAAAIAALYSENAVQITPDGVFNKRAGVEKRYTALFNGRDFKDHLNTLDQVHTPLAYVPWAVGGSTVTLRTRQYKRFRILTCVPAPDGKAWLVNNEIDVY